MKDLGELQAKTWETFQQATRDREAGELGALGNILDEMDAKFVDWNSRLEMINSPSSSPAANGVAPLSDDRGQWVTCADDFDFAGRGLKEATLFGNALSVRMFKDLLLEVCRALELRDLAAFKSAAVRVHGRFSYFSLDRKDLRSPMKLEKTGVFVETNLSSNSIVKIVCRRLLRELGHRPEELRLKVGPPGSRRRRRGSPFGEEAL